MVSGPAPDYSKSLLVWIIPSPNKIVRLFEVVFHFLLFSSSTVKLYWEIFQLFIFFQWVRNAF